MCVGGTDVVGHHDGEQRLVVGVEGHVECGGLHHNEDGVENCGALRKNNNRQPGLYHNMIQSITEGEGGCSKLTAVCVNCIIKLRRSSIILVRTAQ